uniref:Integrin_alpha2 domain-containing protein n=1 Tax=Haemonchus placei TaxID=6290 RepID=A0A0N4VXU6_HAEPC
LVVGAPESDTTNPNLRGIRRPGAVYVCSVNKPTCREVHVDKKRTFLQNNNSARPTRLSITLLLLSGSICSSHSIDSETERRSCPW